MTENAPLGIGFHLRRTGAASKWTAADDETSARNSQSHGGDKWQHISYVLAAWYGNEKGQRYFGLCCTNSVSSWSWDWSSPSTRFWGGSIWVAALSVRRVCTRMTDKWVGVPSRASVVMKDSRWGTFQCFLENWHVWEQARKPTEVNLFGDGMTLKKQASLWS